jgi:parallel beta-helix repeat protein
MATSKKKQATGKRARRPAGDQARSAAPSARTRAVILTALPVEYSAVRTHLSDLREQTHEQGTVYEEGTFQGEQLWDVTLVEIGAGNVKTAAEAERAMQHFRPQVLLFVGVAGGLKDVRVGDVVIATKVYGYESGKAESESEFRPRPQAFGASYRLEQRARAEARRPDWMMRLKSSAGEPKPRVLLGPIAAGEVVVASRASEISRFIQENYGDSLAVEMEGRGLLEAASINERVDALVIRGISDLLDKKTDSDALGSQELAAAHASAFAFELLANIEAAALQPVPASAKGSSSGDLPDYPPPQAKADTRVVDIAGKGHHRTIAEAIEAATPGEQILVKPGLYEEQIVLTKVLELVGEGRQDDVVVQCSKTSCLSFRATLGRVSNITFRQIGSTDEPCIDIGQGRLELETCSVSSQTATGIVVRNAADPRIRYCNIHDNKSAGILVSSDGVGTVEENTLFHNGQAGIEVTTGGSPTVRGNIIRDNRGPGVFAHDQGTGVLDGNDIFGNEDGVSVAVSSKLTILRNTIHDNGGAGVQIRGQAEGVVELNKIDGHRQCVVVAHESRCTIRENRIRRSSGSGIQIFEGSQAVIERNKISEHSYFGVHVLTESSASIRQNQIYSCSASGVRVGEKASATIEGNRVARNQHLGIDVDSPAHIVIRGNAIVKNKGVGVRARKTDTLTLENNDLRENLSPKSLADISTIFDSGNKE